LNKGIGPLIILVIIGAIALYGVLCAYIFGRTIVDQQAQIESSVITTINKMEYIKREIPAAMRYSFYQSIYDVANRGGGASSSSSYNCIPYWNIFGQDTIPNYQENSDKVFLTIFSKYLSSMSDSSMSDSTISLPNFQVNKGVAAGKLTVSSNEPLMIANPEFYTVKDSSTFSIDVSPDTIGIFDAGKDAANQLTETISKSSSYSDALSEVINLQSSLDTKYSGHYNIIIQPEGNLGNGSSKFAFRIRVIIVDTNDKYPIYDFSENKNDYKNVALSFYLFEGTDSSIHPQINSCSPINY